MKKLENLSYDVLQASYDEESVVPDYGFVSQRTYDFFRAYTKGPDSVFVQFTALKFANATILACTAIPDGYILWTSKTGKSEKPIMVPCPTCGTQVEESSLR